MEILIVEAILIALIAGSALMGLVRGLIQTVGSILGTIFGVWIAGYYAADLADALIPFLGSLTVARTISFFVLFLIVSRVISWLFFWLDRAYHLIQIIPFLGSINRIGGLLLGGVLGLAVVALGVALINDFTLALPLKGLVVKTHSGPVLIALGHQVQDALPGLYQHLLALINSGHAR
ncbi:MAG: CvpA family protein [Candidatus Buchananbacteria bacterium]|nr:CvpA family protein [Candidatus Buchananbacteria bacterium]